MRLVLPALLASAAQLGWSRVLAAPWRLSSISSQRPKARSSAAPTAAAAAGATPSAVASAAMEPAQQQPSQFNCTYSPDPGTWDPEVAAYLEAALGPERLAAISAALTRPPLATCLRVNTLRTTPEVRRDCSSLHHCHVQLSTGQACIVQAHAAATLHCTDRSVPRLLHCTGAAAPPVGSTDT